MAKILLVEDDAMIASGITYALEMEGYEATCVTNIRDALTAIQRMIFDRRLCPSSSRRRNYNCTFTKHTLLWSMYHPIIKGHIYVH